ncbi:hypothetical protein RINTHM_8090 [Richelia intracellularis HM01]|nr:hypothetical protein RINTHM_8090 [Richelia intracellularis HM01]
MSQGNCQTRTSRVDHPVDRFDEAKIWIDYNEQTHFLRQC